jgi:GntR family transcriptional regulator, transcriptional repressor for pyruvate dehydrogenase complex
LVLPKLSRVTLAEQAAQTLMDFIVAQDLKPGDAIPSEGDLALQFGVSRTIVREALKCLAGKNVIEVVNGRRAVIKPLDTQPLNTYFQRALHFDRKTVIELMEVRRGLEVESARLAAERRTSEQLGKLTETVAAMAEQLHDPDRFADRDVEFHLQIATAAQNKMLYLLVESIREFLREASKEGLRRGDAEGRFGTAYIIHKRLLRELEKGDPDGAAQAMTAHFDGQLYWLNRPD